MKDFHCPVCGYSLREPAWIEGAGGSFDICPSCGIQFGYEDAAPGGLEARRERWRVWRAQWIADGTPWRGLGKPPDDFDPPAQIARIDP